MIKTILKYTLMMIGYILGAIIFGVIYFLMILGIMIFAYSM